MKFGYLEDISAVDFTLPLDHTSNQQVLSGQSANHLEVRIGIPRWNVKEWRGKVFPKGTKDMLKAYSSVLNSIEMNTTHYRIPRKEQVAKWKDSTQNGFLFCPKAPQSISHRNPLNAKSDNALLFFNNMQLFGRQLGRSFMQLSPHFKTDRLEDLIRFLEGKPLHFALAVELRHESWFEEEASMDRLIDTMRKTNVAVVMSDTAGRRDALHMRLSSPEVVVRFVGNDLHESDFQRLDDWTERLAKWREMGLNRCYFFVHQHNDGLLPETINYFIDAMERKGIKMQPKIPIQSRA